MSNMTNPPRLDPEAVSALHRKLAVEWGIRVDERMKATGVSTTDLAEACSTSRQTIHKIRRGEIAPRESLRYLIAITLDTSPGDLFPPPSRDRIIGEAS